MSGSGWWWTTWWIVQQNNWRGWVYGDCISSSAKRFPQWWCVSLQHYTTVNVSFKVQTMKFTNPLFLSMFWAPVTTSTFCICYSAVFSLWFRGLRSQLHVARSCSVGPTVVFSRICKTSHDEQRSALYLAEARLFRILKSSLRPYTAVEMHKYRVWFKWLTVTWKIWSKFYSTLILKYLGSGHIFASS